MEVSYTTLRLHTNAHINSIKCYVPINMKQKYLKEYQFKSIMQSTYDDGLGTMNKCKENLQISVELALILPQDFSPGYMYLTKLLYVSYQTDICISRIFSSLHNMIVNRMGNATSDYRLLLARVKLEALKHLSKHLYWVRLYHYNTS